MGDPSELPVIGLVGPAENQPCGIADYVRRLEAALSQRCHLIPAGYPEALADEALAGCRAVLVHYERSLVPGPDWLDAMARKLPGRIFVAPHEVYREDPFAFPYAGLRSAFPPLLWLKRLRYRVSHRDYAREQELQARGYSAHRVIPLSREGADILRERAAGPSVAARILPPVPIARIDPPPPPDSPRSLTAQAAGFPAGVRAVAGIFGFLNPGLDYGAAFDLVASLEGRLGLFLLGGERRGYPMRESLEAEIRRRRLEGLARITGYLPEAELAGRLAACDLFLCPMRFKSSSASVLQLFRQGKPILVPDLPLTRYLKDEGAPLDLYASAADLRERAAAVLDGRLRAPQDRYPWDIEAVAVAYLKAMLAGVPAASAAPSRPAGARDQ